MKEDTLNDIGFSQTYAEARRRFLDAAQAAGASMHSYTIDSEPETDLTFDVAVIGSNDAPAIVISSGVHGVEGFLGSAVQLALLQRISRGDCATDIRYVLIHAVNPFGFADLRRFNEDNVDLNRNFLTGNDEYSGAPEGYADLNGFLNPESPPSRFEPFRLKAIWNICLRGQAALKEAVAGGQYEYPRALFFGGWGPCKSTQIVQDNCDSWLAASQRILHIDFHSGLGPWASYKLLLTESSGSRGVAWYADAFGAEYVEPTAQQDGTAYRARGVFGQWMQDHFHQRDYRFAGAEFGTYGVIRILGAIRAENRAHHHCSKDSPPYLRAKDEIRECFCPDSPSWRQQVVESGLRIIDQGVTALSALEDTPNR